MQQFYVTLTNYILDPNTKFHINPLITCRFICQLYLKKKKSTVSGTAAVNGRAAYWNNHCLRQQCCPPTCGRKPYDMCDLKDLFYRQVLTVSKGMLLFNCCPPPNQWLPWAYHHLTAAFPHPWLIYPTSLLAPIQISLWFFYPWLFITHNFHRHNRNTRITLRSENSDKFGQSTFCIV
jgi:hypothetical protein